MRESGQLWIWLDFRVVPVKGQNRTLGWNACRLRGHCRAAILKAVLIAASELAASELAASESIERTARSLHNCAVWTVGLR